MSLHEEDIVRAILRHRSRLLAYIWAIVQDSFLAEDVFQEVSLLAVRQRSELRSVEALPSWLFKTARFQALGAIRDRGREQRRLSEAALDQLTAVWGETDDADRQDYVAALHHCVERLTPRSQRLVSLRYFEGRKTSEIAEVLNRSVDSIYVSLSRIYTQLRECIGRELAKEEGEHA